MSVTIVPVQTKRQMRQFVNFTLELYKDCPYYVPELTIDTKATLDPKKNPAFEFCKAQPMLALREGRVVGRVVALINKRVNEVWNHKVVRFSWIDFIADYEVCKALLDAVCAWGRERGMNKLEGPMGFTDWDREGAMTSGFDRIATLATIYNYPYYVEYYERYGLGAGADWLEHLVTMPEVFPERYDKMANLIRDRYNLKVVFAKNNSELKNDHAKRIFALLNQCYAHLYGFSPVSDKQIDKYVADYIPFVDVSLIPLIYNQNDELVACAIVMPSLAKAMHRTHGKLFPFGWWHLVKSLYLKHDDTLELLLIGIRPDFQGKGLNALLISAMHPVIRRKGYVKAETNCELVTNDKMQNFWNYLPHETHKTRRAYIMDI